jgi:hypothetical protein
MAGGGQFTATATAPQDGTINPMPINGFMGSVVGQAVNQLVPLVNAQQQSNQAQTPTVPTPTNTPALLPSTPIQITSEQAGASKIDPALRPFLTEGLRQAQNLFLGGNQPQFYPGQTYVSPSQQTLDALATQEAIARSGAPTLQQAQGAYQQSLGGLGFTGAGGFLQGSPYQQAAMESAIRPIQQQFSNQVLPGVASLYSKAGRYGSGAMQNALQAATEAQTRAIGDITGSMANQQYQFERGLQQQALGQQAQLAAAAPSIYSQQFLPSQQLANIGAAREQIAQMPLQESMNRFYYQQQLPVQQLQSYLSSVYGSPMSGSQYAPMPTAQRSTLTNVLGGAGLGYGIGNMIGGSGLFGTSAGTTGAVLGGLGGLLL